MQRQRLAPALAAGVLAFAVSAARADTIFVGPGAVCATLACGIAAANATPPGPGVNVLVDPGTYAEGPLVITRPHTRVVGRGKPRISASSPVNFGTGVIEVVASDVEVCGFDIAYSPENDYGGSGFGAQGSAGPNGS